MAMRFNIFNDKKLSGKYCCLHITCIIIRNDYNYYFLSITR